MNREFDESRDDEGFSNNSESHYQMGMNILSGLSENKDLSEAVTLFREAANFFLQAADQGHALSQFKLAVMYKLGWGVQQEDAEADKWFSLAGGTATNEVKCPLSEIVKEVNDRAEWFKEAIRQGYTGNEFMAL